MGKKITTFAGIKKGQKFRVIANNGGHNYPMGEVLTFKKPGSTLQSMSDVAEEQIGNNIRASEIELVNYTVEDILSEIKELEKQIEDLTLKAEFCYENGLKEYDENLFRILKAVKIINTFSTDIDKAKQLALLLN